MTNLCFMELGETNEVRPFNCVNCNDLKKSLDMVIDELKKVINEYNKLAQEKKDWQILLEAIQIEVGLLTEDLEEIKMQLNNIRKSPSHSPGQSNQTTLYRRNSPNHSFYKSNKSSSNSYSPETSVKINCYTCGDLGHKSFNCRKYTSGKWIWRPETSNHQGSKNTWIPKRN